MAVGLSPPNEKARQNPLEILVNFREQHAVRPLYATVRVCYCMLLSAVCYCLLYARILLYATVYATDTKLEPLSDLNFDPNMSQSWHEYFIISCTCAQKQYLDFRSLNFADPKPHQMVWFACQLCDPCIGLLRYTTCMDFSNCHYAALRFHSAVVSCQQSFKTSEARPSIR